MNKISWRRLGPWTLWMLAVGGAIAGLTVFLLVLAGRFQPKVPADRAPRSGPALTAPSMGQVQRVRRRRFETAVGTIRPVHEAAVASKLLARVTEVQVKAGQTVNQGDVLVRLDDADLRARFKQMESAYEAAQALAERATAEHQRAQKLIAGNAISQAEFDQALALLKTAQAEVRRAQQAVEEAKVLLEFATIRSPLTGIVIDKRVEPGDTASPGQTLVSLYEPDRMQMVATVRESLALRLKVGDQLPARLDALDHECLATVSEIVPQAEVASRSFTVKVTGPCPPGVYSGMFGRLSIPLDDEEVVVVPSAAVVRIGQLELVDIVHDRTISRRAVQLGGDVEGGWEVLSGLTVGEQVVLHAPGERGR